ncbi:Glutathione S-transferase [Cinnamomum micranthum f. kanehirae]|uniref:Glutathione S-transferase n=1 Tax=Cinnamomum micranthum f. kanehirae TaxID=337451 RepID=A0A3S3NA15_9MAGN|nr:Glutathione S-transferase [Cinnamomum micranthum f. kanehirae]
MASVLSFRHPPSLQPSSPARNFVRRIPLRVSAQFPESPSSSSSVSTKVVVEEGEEKLGFSSSSPIIPPPNFKPPEPKQFAIRPDKTFEILSASLALIFRLGTGIFVQGYSASFVSEEEIPPGKYALKLAGLTVKETSKLGPRPEKPIEIYEFERLEKL